MILDFGAYRGWDLSKLLQHNPDYVVWLASILTTHNESIAHASAYARKLLEGYDVDPAFSEACRQRKQIMQPIVDIIKRTVVVRKLKHGYDNRWFFRIMSNIERGFIPAPNVRNAIADACGKTWGRRGSKKYKSIHTEICTVFDAALNIKCDGNGLSDSLRVCSRENLSSEC